MLDELVQFAKKYHSGFAEFTDEQVWRFFYAVRKTTLLSFGAWGELVGFAIYREYPDNLYFYCVAFAGSRFENFRAIRAGLNGLTKKMIFWHDDNWMVHRCLLRL